MNGRWQRTQVLGPISFECTQKDQTWKAVTTLSVHFLYNVLGSQKLVAHLLQICLWNAFMQRSFWQPYFNMVGDVMKVLIQQQKDLGCWRSLSLKGCEQWLCAEVVVFTVTKELVEMSSFDSFSFSMLGEQHSLYVSENDAKLTFLRFQERLFSVQQYF